MNCLADCQNTVDAYRMGRHFHDHDDIGHTVVCPYPEPALRIAWWRGFNDAHREELADTREYYRRQSEDA